MNRQLLEQVFASITEARVLVVGDLILDKYVWGSVSRISPEAPVQVVEVDREEVRLGAGSCCRYCSRKIWNCLASSNRNNVKPVVKPEY